MHVPTGLGPQADARGSACIQDAALRCVDVDRSKTALIAGDVGGEDALQDIDGVRPGVIQRDVDPALVHLWWTVRERYVDFVPADLHCDLQPHHLLGAVSIEGTPICAV